MEPIRISKYFTDCGVMSRRAADAAVERGEVKVNGVTAVLGQKVDPDTDTVTWKGKRIVLPATPSKTVIMLNKPRGYLTTLSDDKGRHTVAELVADAGVRLYPVGRLDMDSEGLLLFTNDGDFANRLMHPSHGIDKIYRVSVDGYTPEGLARFQCPMSLDGYRLRIPDVQLISVEGTKAQLEITIHEGRNRQVRRMCAIAGMRVHRLIRIGEGSLRLGDLPCGKWRYLTQEEYDRILA